MKPTSIEVWWYMPAVLALRSQVQRLLDLRGLRSAWETVKLYVKMKTENKVTGDCWLIFFKILNGMSVFACTTCMQGPKRPGEDIRFPAPGVTEGCELLCGCWDSNLGSLEKDKVLLSHLSSPPTWQICENLCDRFWMANLNFKVIVFFPWLWLDLRLILSIPL